MRQCRKNQFHHGKIRINAVKDRLQARSQHAQVCKDPRRQCLFRDLDLWPFGHKINGLAKLIVKHFSVTFGDSGCISF